MKEPFQFNPLKHHLQYIKRFCFEYRRSFDEEQFKSRILEIGQNVTDIYTGEMKPDEIADEIRVCLFEINSFRYENYARLLADSESDYLNYQLSDESKWTITLGDDKQYYIHIHPSRESRFVFRARNNSLKTAVAMAVLYRSDVNFTLQFVNDLRRKYLGLPPIKSMGKTSSILKIYRMLNST